MRSEQEKQVDILSLEMVGEFMDMDRTARGKAYLRKEQESRIIKMNRYRRKSR